MPRKSPRSRRPASPAPRVPAPLRAPTSPRKKTTRAPARPKSPPVNGRAAHVPRARPPGEETATPRRGTQRRTTPASSSRRAATTTRRPATTSRRPSAAATRPPAAGRRPAARRAPKPDPARAAAILEILARTYPGATTALNHDTPLQLLVATILSAQCTDARVNQVTPALFAHYPDAAAFEAADAAELEAMIQSTGFFRMKARAIRECARDLVARHGGAVPRTLEELTALRGVGRKTANVVLGNAYGIPGLVVDTHVGRLAFRLGLTVESDPVKIEFALMAIVPREQWTRFSHWLILHGRAICVARKPRCSVCPLLPHCPRLGVTKSV